MDGKVNSFVPGGSREKLEKLNNVCSGAFRKVFMSSSTKKIAIKQISLHLVNMPTCQYHHLQKSICSII